MPVAILDAANQTGVVRSAAARQTRAYAAVSDSSVTSPAPSASDGTLGIVPTPSVLGVVHGLRRCRPLAAAAPRRGCSTCEAPCAASSRSPWSARPREPSRPAASEWARPDDRCSVAGVTAALERGGVDERLEGRARLPVGLHARSKRLCIEVAAANQRAHFAASRLHRDERALERSMRGRGSSVFLPFGGARRSSISASASPTSRSAALLHLGSIVV